MQQIFSTKQGYSMGGTPIFITWFEPFARLTLYLTDLNTLSDLGWSNVANHLIKDYSPSEDRTARRPNPKGSIVMHHLS